MHLTKNKWLYTLSCLYFVCACFIVLYKYIHCILYFWDGYYLIIRFSNYYFKLELFIISDDNIITFSQLMFSVTKLYIKQNDGNLLDFQTVTPFIQSLLLNKKNTIKILQEELIQLFHILHLANWFFTDINNLYFLIIPKMAIFFYIFLP